MKARRAPEDRRAFLVMEEAVALVRNAPLRILAYYYAGSLPFVLGVFYFWADITMHADAYARIGPLALALGGLFLWMKCWHTIYARALDAHLRDLPPPVWSGRQILRMAINQLILQPIGLVVLPLSLLLVLPFGWLYAYFQHLTVLDDGEESNYRALARRAWEHAQKAPRQNLICVWLLSPVLLIAALTVWFVFLPTFGEAAPVFMNIVLALLLMGMILLTVLLNPLGVILAINFVALLALIPQLLRMLLGIETVITRVAGAAFDPSFLFAAGCLTFLSLDPLAKAVYVLRSFYTTSTRTGDDLRAELRRIRTAITVVMLIAGLLCGGGAWATESGVSPTDLDSSIEQVLEQREFMWRTPRLEPRQFEGEGAVMRSLRWAAEHIENAVETVREWYNRVREWYRSQFEREPDPGRGFSPMPRSTLETVGYVLMVGVLMAAAILAWRTWRMRQLRPAESIEQAEPDMPDIEDEGTSADALPEDGWLAMAHDLMAKGDHRLALRALFLASLAWLHRQGLVAVDRGKSNRDYLRELDRRGHGGSELLPAFQSMVSQFERVWYGQHEADDELLRAFMARREQMQRSLHAVEGQQPPALTQPRESAS